jgi:uncharacterized protein YdeI (YjbR/CyaY-like superfamily)
MTRSYIKQITAEAAATDHGVDEYIDRSDTWPDEMRALRTVLLEAGLGEDIMWAKPCYSRDGSNIAIMHEMKKFLALLFFKGALLEDPGGILESQGPNSRSAMRVCFRSIGDVERLAPATRRLVAAAIKVEESGEEIGPAPAPVWAEELRGRLESNDAFRTAFEGLTPGRQREYNLHFSSSKQSSTRESRVEKCAPKILAGKGFRDR